jgi:aminoglycoside phosphotransferase (APT) family kinase protein
LELTSRLENIVDLLARVVATTEVDPNYENIPLRLMRVDPNLSNAIVDSDKTLRWIDWEYSGWGDPALDLAELRWHASLQSLGDYNLQWLRSNYQLSFNDPNFYPRLKVWDHILVTRWPFLILRSLWSNHNGPDRERLSTVAISKDQLHQRLRKMIRKAECFYSSDDWL